MEDMNSTIWRLMNECIAEMQKLLIWLENAYKQTNKQNQTGMKMVRTGSRNGKGEEEGADLLPLPFRSIF